MSETDAAEAEAPPDVSAAVMADPAGARNVVATSVAVPVTSEEEVGDPAGEEPEPITQVDTVPVARAPVRDRALAGDRWIARVLRGGAVLSGGMFVASLALEALPQSETAHVAIDLLRKGAASLLLVTPVARLGVAGTLLGLRGEWRYAAIAAGVLGLLAIAVGTGIHP